MTHVQREMRAVVLCSASLFSVGCAVISPLPDVRTPEDHAHDLDAKCAEQADGAETQIVSADLIDSVEPAIAHVASGPSGSEPRLQGARIHLRPVAGATREALTRELECHEARVTLSRAAAVANDPYVLAGRWLSIDVDSEKDGFVATVSIDEISDARQVLARAQAFAKQRRVAPPQSDPPSPASSTASPPSTAGHAAPLQ